MKVVKAQEMMRIEKMAYEQGASERAFMEKAGEGVAELVRQCIAQDHLTPRILLLCGRGNNAGDAYVAGRLLKEGGFDVRAIALVPLEQSSPLCQLQGKNFLQQGGEIVYVDREEAVVFGDAEILIDGLLGTGFHGEVQGLLAALIEKANQSSLPIVAIDVPSGVNGNTGIVGDRAIRAQHTLFLGLPKTGCFLQHAWNFVGKVHVFNFGLQEGILSHAQPDFSFLDLPYIQSLIPPLLRTRHKYQAGYVLGVGGSSHMPGAPLLASYAALRAGAGIVRLCHPEGMEPELAASPPEIIKQGFRQADWKKTLFPEMQRASALFIGPGMGLLPKTAKCLKEILSSAPMACVVDADALTLIAEYALEIPQQAILTPHYGEMKRLLGIKTEVPYNDFLSLCQRFAEERKIVLVLKGAPTFIFHSEGIPYICGEGDPGMATAGSGDVLTGILSAFLAQGKAPLEAAILGVYFHAVAGGLAAKKKSSYAMVASDITEALPAAYHALL